MSVTKLASWSSTALAVTDLHRIAVASRPQTYRPCALISISQETGLHLRIGSDVDCRPENAVCLQKLTLLLATIVAAAGQFKWKDSFAFATSRCSSFSLSNNILAFPTMFAGIEVSPSIPC